MPVTILKFIWPFLEKYLAKQAATYLQAHRERRLAPSDGAGDEDSVQECPAHPGGVGRTLAFTTLGVAIGSGLGFVVGQLINQDK